jgi:hypothetical protein
VKPEKAANGLDLLLHGASAYFYEDDQPLGEISAYAPAVESPANGISVSTELPKDDAI